jgi:hypothetical protein
MQPLTHPSSEQERLTGSAAMNRERAGARRTSGFERRDHVEERSRPSALDAISPRIEAFVRGDIIRVPTEPVSPTLADSELQRTRLWPSP